MATFAIILSNLKSMSLSPVILCCCALIIPAVLVPLLVQASPPFLSYIGSNFSSPYSHAVQPLRRVRVQLRVL
jgi:hypothetical protein